jgi:hypothetical protein
MVASLENVRVRMNVDFSVLMNAARQSIKSCLLSERQTWSSNYLCWWKCYFEMYLRRISGPMFRGDDRDDFPVISKDVDGWFDECLSCCSFDVAAISFIALEHHSPRLVGLLGCRVETRILLPYVIAVVGYYIVWTLVGRRVLCRSCLSPISVLPDGLSVGNCRYGRIVTQPTLEPWGPHVGWG